VGGAFYLNGVKTTRGTTSTEEFWRGGELQQSYKGFFIADIPHTGAWFGNFPPDAWGAQAYAKLKPTKPVMNLANSIFELKDIPRMLKNIINIKEAVKSYRSFKAGARTSGSSYLEYKFGWEQLYRDVRRLCDAQRKAQKKLDWLLRNEGKPVPVETKPLLDSDDIVEDFAISGYGLLQPVLATQFYKYEPRGRRLTHNTEKVWAKGRFRWWLPPGPRNIDWTKKMMQSLYGTDITPSVVYNAIPWTWLFDWFSHFGDMVENLESGVAERVVADYWYLMRRKEWTITNNVTGWFVDKNLNEIQVHASSSSSAFVKARVKGDPFGFGTSNNSLDPGQIAILGALGLSRLP
jgi:hypothetical protein